MDKPDNNQSDRNRDDVPDVFQRIEEILVGIRDRLPEVSASGIYEQLQEKRQSVATQLSQSLASGQPVQTPPQLTTQLSVANQSPQQQTTQQSAGGSTLLQQILLVLQQIQRSLLGGQPQQRTQQPSTGQGISQPQPTVTTQPLVTSIPTPQRTSPQSMWATIIDQLTGRTEQHRQSINDERSSRKRFVDARSELHRAPMEMQAAQNELNKAVAAMNAAQRAGANIRQQTLDLEAVRERYRSARERMSDAPLRYQEAEGEYRGTRAARQQQSVGSAYRMVGRLASAFGMESFGQSMENAANTASTTAKAAAGDPSARAQLAQQIVQQVGQGAQQAGAGVRRMATTERAGESLAGFGQVLSGFGSATGSPVVGAVGKFAQVVGESVEKLRRWNDQLIEGHFRFAEFSGAMAQVQAESEARNIQLAQERGERRAPAARRLAEERDRFERNMAPLEDAISGVWSELRATITALANEVIEAITGKNEPTDGQQSGLTLGEFIRSSGMQHQQELFGRPGRFPSTGTGANNWLPGGPRP